MDMEDIVWNTDAKYALGTYKFITWTTGTWPLQDEGIFAMIRFTIAFILEFSLLASVLLEIRLNCGNTDKTLEFFGLTAGMTTGLTKLIFVKLHQKDLRKILLSAIKDWSSIKVKNSSAKEIIWKYTHRGKLVCRVQMSLGLLIIGSMILDAVPTSDSLQQDNTTLSEENIRQIPLRTMCLFGNMSTSSYWIVFVLQGVQLLNSIAVNMGNDVFFFAIAMHICGQLDALRILCDDFKANDEKDRVLKIEKFVRRHCHLLELAQRLENTLTNILLVNLMTDGFHTCLAGIQIIIMSNNIDIVPLTKVSSVIIIILAQLFLYSYAGDSLSSLFQDICQVIYNCPWYEFSPNNVRNLMFIIMKTHIPFHLTAGRFYIMDIENFKNIMKTCFSLFSLLRIVFVE
ncbi:odorant receptor 13a-like [Vespa crabro]|uniref:odorant receptor 13a-like n=1 Tax=Vespa crabro TaxID=7445 RepID=UPI001EFF6704|nr:odorant receptor 13a-like [Vespa crabro]